MNKEIEIKKLILIEASEDYVGLWSVIAEIKEYNQEVDLFSINKQTVKLIKELLDDQLVQAGQFNTTGKFETWNISSDAIINRIQKEWDELNREPRIGDIVWFISTEKGEAEIS